MESQPIHLIHLGFVFVTPPVLSSIFILFVVVKSHLPELRLRYYSHSLIISSMRAAVDRLLRLEKNTTLTLLNSSPVFSAVWVRALPNEHSTE
jgi:hypothetical protein